MKLYSKSKTKLVVKFFKDGLWRDIPLFLQSLVSLFSVLAISDQIPVQIVDEPQKTDFLSKGLEGGITVGSTSRVLPFELVSSLDIFITISSFLIISSLIITFAAKISRSVLESHPLGYILPPFLFCLSFYISIGMWPHIHWCYASHCTNTWLYLTGPSAKLLPVFTVLQSLIVGLVAWIYVHERIPDSVSGDRDLVKHHMQSWWNRINAINQFLLALVVGLSLPFVLDRTGLGIWTILVLVSSFGFSVLTILYFTFKKADAVEEDIENNSTPSDSQS